MSDLSPAAVVYDADGNVVTMVTEQTARDVLRELRKLEIHLHAMTGENITDEDVA